jgi:hypothetical protein
VYTESSSGEEEEDEERKLMLVTSVNPLPFCRLPEIKERCIWDERGPIALMLFSWDAIELIDMGLHVYQISYKYFAALF